MRSVDRSVSFARCNICVRGQEVEAIVSRINAQPAADVVELLCKIGDQVWAIRKSEIGGVVNDNDIIKALEHCSKGGCTSCPIHHECCADNMIMEKEALNLINRQKAEIEKKSRTIRELVDARRGYEILAIKKFAKKLKEEMQYSYLNFITASEIDALVSEMTAKTENPTYEAQKRNKMFQKGGSFSENWSIEELLGERE